MRGQRLVRAGLIVGFLTSVGALQAKDGSAFFPEPLVAKARENVAQHSWAAAIRDRVVKAAEPWVKMSDEELWQLQFGSTITRTWMVWSNGICPACKKDVPMYSWKIDALGQPWKVRCPHCQELFPKNDFHAFYRSGLDEHNVFDPKRADRSLLFNVEHPDAADPLHGFGVDDGEGYVEGDKRWRFIGAYLIYGQWKQAIVSGCRKLADAYVLTGDAKYAHKAGVLLDRAADVYPTFDYKAQGLVYETAGHNGYVSVWHDACEETRDLILSYDMVLAGIRQDNELQKFLAAKAQQCKLDNPKSDFADIRRNFEQRVLVDCQQNRPKIESNYPQTDVTIAFAKTAMAWPENRDEVGAIIKGICAKNTAIDGTSGEKGLAGYSAYAISGLARLLATYARIDPAFLQQMFEESPRLREAFHFHMDCWCLQAYYPSCGDSGSFCSKVETLVSIPWSSAASLMPSMYSFAWQLYELTGDERYVQAMYQANGRKLDGMPYNLFGGDPAAFQQKVKQIVDRTGPRLDITSVNKKEWHVALLRSGKGDDERVLWLDYDNGGNHSHHDGMNLGLYAKGLDLMPDFGYPPVQYGGWDSPRANWYKSSMAHNTVVVDGRDTVGRGGATTLWADGKRFHAVRASCPAMIAGTQYERTAAMVDISDRDSYVVDIFRVTGGSEHAKFVRSHFGAISTQGVPDTAAEVFPDVPHMRNWRGGSVEPGCSVDWKIEDRYGYLAKSADVHVRHTDLTNGAQLFAGESWISAARHGFTDIDEQWVPHFVVRRQGKAPLSSTFVSVVEPYDSRSRIEGIRRLPVQASHGGAGDDSEVAVEIMLTGGTRDVYVSRKVEDGAAATRPADYACEVKDVGLKLDGQGVILRLAPDGKPLSIGLCRASAVTVGGTSISLSGRPEYVEIAFEDGKGRVVAGDAAGVTIGP